jgi:hypothetical protein
MNEMSALEQKQIFLDVNATSGRCTGNLPDLNRPVDAAVPNIIKCRTFSPPT